MITKLARLLSPGRRKEEGFTLIELLIVVAIIAILAAIAIPQFSAYRRRGYNAAANSDLRNIRTVQEAMFSDNQDYGVSRTAAADVAPQNTSQLVDSATIYLVGGNTGSTNMQAALSSGVRAQVNAGPAAQRHSNFAAASGHATGDSYYGAESDSTAMYKCNFGTPGLMTNTVINVTSTAGSDFTGNCEGTNPWKI